MRSSVAKGRTERMMAKICLASLGAASLFSIAPDEAFSSSLFVGLAVLVATALLATWVYLMASHLFKLVEQPRSYTICQTLGVVFVPVIGAVLVSLRRTDPSRIAADAE